MWNLKVPAGLFVLLGHVLALGCDSDEPPLPPDAPMQPEREVLSGDTCGVGLTIDTVYLVEGGFVVRCVSLGSNHPPSLIRFNEATRTSTLIDRDFAFPPSSHVRGWMLGETLYLNDSGSLDTYSLFAIRTDGGETSPIMVTSSKSFGGLAVSATHVYWGWSHHDSATNITTNGLSRAPISGGAEELVTSLPFSPSEMVLLGDEFYAIGFPNPETRATSILRISIAGHSFETIRTDLPGASAGFWLASYRDRVLWYDHSSIPPKFYEIHGSSFSTRNALDCPPGLFAVFWGSVVVRNCTQIWEFMMTDVETWQSWRYELPDPGDSKPPTLIGGRPGYIYFWSADSLVRVRLPEIGPPS